MSIREEDVHGELPFILSLLIRKLNDFESIVNSKKSSSIIFHKRDLNTSSIQAAEILYCSPPYINPIKPSSPKIQRAAKNKPCILVN
uniref:Uncharacterized protein n=1 Tax=Arundo donax TaxID=35708 RepID=A0A0A9EI02_ARUDO